jgi:hypothetical protein
MRIYDGSPRQDWEEVLRAIGRFVDQEQLKELLFVELEGGFLLQGLALPKGGHDSDTMGTLTKRTYELTDEQVAQLMDDSSAHRGTAEADQPEASLTTYYEHAMRVVGGWVDGQRTRDLFFLEQDGSFVIRMLIAKSGGTIGHELAEFTKDEIVAMIEAAPQHRGNAPAKAGAESTGEASS